MFCLAVSRKCNLITLKSNQINNYHISNVYLPVYCFNFQVSVILNCQLFHVFVSFVALLSRFCSFLYEYEVRSMSLVTRYSFSLVSMKGRASVSDVTITL